MLSRMIKGMTLVELMVVVAILGILAVVAVFSYKRYIRRARIQEGVTFLMDIKMKQETYFATYSQYVDTAATVNDFYPPNSNFAPAVPLPAPWSWDCSSGSLTTAETGFCALGIEPRGEVDALGRITTWFQYLTIGWAPGDANPPAAYISDPSRRWWFAIGRSYWDEQANLPIELRLSSELNSVVQIE